MKKLGILLIFIGLGLIFYFTIFTITGSVIGEKNGIKGSFLGLVFIIIGLVLFLTKKKEGNLAKIALESGKILNTKEILKLSRNMGYQIEKGHKEGTRIYNENKVLTVIPNHKQIEGKGTYIGIMKDLVSGESSFNKRRYGS